MEKTKKIRPPAYPQVEYVDEAIEYITKCRFCGKKNDIPAKVTDQVKPDHSVKSKCECGNVFKIIYRAQVDE